MFCKWIIEGVASEQAFKEVREAGQGRRSQETASLVLWELRELVAS